jgi:hypothetical protein
MNFPSVYALARVAKPRRTVDRADTTFFTSLLLVSALLCGGLAAQRADARLLITTTGTITTGTQTGGLFGMPSGTTSLVGDSYTLLVEYDGLGPNYFTTGDGSFAFDSETPGTSGFVTATINGHPLTTALTNSLGSLLLEDLFSFNASNQGYNGPSNSGAFVNVVQGLSCGNQCVPFADLRTPFSYVLGPLDFGSDSYTFQAAGYPAPGTPNASFTGTEASFAFAPEPASWMLAAIGLFAMGMLPRRRRA